MRFTFEMEWFEGHNMRRREKFSLFIENFKVRPVLVLGRYTKQFGWLGLWLTYDGKLLQWLRRDK